MSVVPMEGSIVQVKNLIPLATWMWLMKVAREALELAHAYGDGKMEAIEILVDAGFQRSIAEAVVNNIKTEG